MDDKTTVRQYFAAVEAGDIDRLSHLLADDFIFDHQAAPQPLGRTAYLDVMAALGNGIEDWKFNVVSGPEGASPVTSTVRITGRQVADVDLSAQGLGIAVSNGNTFQLPAETCNFHVNNGKISKISIPDVGGGGLPGILEQLGPQTATV